MIFVTVGTHEQQFDRLLREIDSLVEQGIITEKVFIQSGYSTYTPKYCEYSKLISYEDMELYAESARVIICHGGPGSIFLAFEKNKTPIVVPRLSEFKEHVDNHQLYFSEMLAKRGKVILVTEISILAKSILEFQNISEEVNINIKSNRLKFVENIKNEIKALMK